MRASRNQCDQLQLSAVSAAIQCLHATTMQNSTTVHLNARAFLSFMDAGECSMVKRASEVTKVERSMATSSREVSHTQLRKGRSCVGTGQQCSSSRVAMHSWAQPPAAPTSKTHRMPPCTHT